MEFTTHITLGIGIGFLVVGLVTLWRVSSCRFYFEHRSEIIGVWKRLLRLAPPAEPQVDVELVSAEEVSFTLKVSGEEMYFSLNGKPQRGKVSYVPVPPDFIGRLGYVDAWENTRFLDGPRFCFSTSQHVPEVVCLARGVRFSWDFNDNELKSQSGQVMNCTLAIHWHIPVNVTDDEEKLDRLFTQFSSLMKMLRAEFDGCLNRQFKKRPYFESLENTPEIIESLNTCWKEAPRFQPYQDLVQIQVTGLVVRPRTEPERGPVESLVAENNRLADEAEKAAFLPKVLGVKYETQWREIKTELPTQLEQFRKAVTAALTNQAESLAANLRHATNKEDCLSAARAAFNAGLEALETRQDGLNAQIRQWKALSVELIRDINQLATKKSEHIRNLLESHAVEERPRDDDSPIEDAPLHDDGLLYDEYTSSLDDGSLYDEYTSSLDERSSSEFDESPDQDDWSSGFLP